MFDLVGWIGEAAVEKLVNIVSSYLRDQFAWGANTKTALHKLNAALLPIKLALREAEKRELAVDQNPELGGWIWQLRDAVEEAEDVLDEMEYYRLERQVLESREEVCLSDHAAASSGFKFKLLNFFIAHGCCSGSMFQNNCVKIGKRAFKMDDTLNKLNAVVAKLELLNKGMNDLNNVISISPLLWGRSSSSIKNSRETGHIVTDEVVGRDEDRAKVLEWLRDSEGDRHGSCNVSALTIWGVGGLGKTTLAQSLYNDDSIDFEVKMWVCVSNNNLDMVELMKKAIETQTGSSSTSTCLSSLQDELKKIVQLKKCLLVLDDVWDGQENQNQQQWENFIGILSRCAEKGSKILVTSRIKYQGLPKKIRSHFLPLGCLKEDQSLSLFYKHALDGVNPKKHANLKSVGDKIAKKCGGLPLGLKIIGGLLNTNLDMSYWLSVLEKDILNLEENMDYVKESLRLSYKCLSSDLQSCFRICSLFPQDYEFQRDELITLWIGLGCINQTKEENRQPEDTACIYLDILVRRSFFVCNHNRGRESYTMHDLLHDFARDVSEGECLRVEKNKSAILPKTLRHLFIDQIKSVPPEDIFGLKKLRTLALTYNYSFNFDPLGFPDYDELSYILKRLKSLRALFVSCKTMPSLSAIEHLKHLRLFHMKVSILNKPLKPLYKLYHLQNLRCEEPTTLSEVHDAHDPVECAGIYTLAKLRHLVLPHRIFDQITQLRHLVELQEVELCLKKNSVIKLTDLHCLNKLRHLKITDEREITRFEEAKEANIDKKGYLETMSLSLKLINSDFQFHEQFCNCLRPQTHSKIKDLKLSNYSGIRAPSWMTRYYLPQVTHLKLLKCENLGYLPPLGQLPSLKVLTLENIAGVYQSGTEFFGSDDIGGFPSLEELRIRKMENWEDWTRAENRCWFPCLKKLYISNCQQLKALPSLPSALKKLEIESVGLIVLPTWHEYEASPSLEELMIYSCEELVQVQPFLRKCVSLKKMKMKKCPKILAHDESTCSDLFDGLSSLTNLEFGDLASLKTLDGLKSLSLSKLEIGACENLASLNGLQAFTSLTGLSIAKCNGLIASSSSNQPHSSFVLHANRVSIDNVKLLQIEPLKSMKSVAEFRVVGDTHARCLPHHWLLQNQFSLTKLQIWLCPMLESLPNELPPSLTSLWIRDCPLLKSLPESTSLKKLWIWDCPLMELLPNSILPSLKSLYIKDCPLLKKQYKRDGGSDWPKIAHIADLLIS